MASISTFMSPLRTGVRKVISTAHDQLIVACPYIRTEEANWFLSELGPKRSSLLRFDVLTDVRSESVLAGSMELDALAALSREIPSSKIVNLPRLHAKVFVADTSFALVTSANLTPGGLDLNFEYGLGISDTSVVKQIRSDIQRYMELGNVLNRDTLEKLQLIARELANVMRPLQDAEEKKLRSRFRLALRQAKTAFLEAQVGQRSANSLFSEAILYVLSYGPLSTRDLHPRIQRLFPELCDDDEILIINGQEFGKKWKHSVRNAQQALKRLKKIHFDGKLWALSS
jgi:hypothetical protein